MHILCLGIAVRTPSPPRSRLRQCGTVGGLGCWDTSGTTCSLSALLLWVRPFRQTFHTALIEHLPPLRSEGVEFSHSFFPVLLYHLQHATHRDAVLKLACQPFLSLCVPPFGITRLGVIEANPQWFSVLEVLSE